MSATRLLLISGMLLLSIAALLGFVQERYRGDLPLFAAWRVVHAGGTAGAVQLLALAATWEQFAAPGIMPGLLAVAVVGATWLFFLGPLATAVGRPRLARLLNIVGAVFAVPAYLGLPIMFV